MATCPHCNATLPVAPTIEHDDLGPYVVCGECEGSFDVDEAENVDENAAEIIASADPLDNGLTPD